MVPDDIVHSLIPLAKRQQPWEYPEHISRANRAVVTNWLWDVYEANDRHHDPRAVCLAITLFDRHMARHRENTDAYQLIALAALWIGSKVHWSSPHRAATLADLCDYTYTRKQLVAAELALLRDNDYAVTGALLPDFCEADDTDLLRAATANPDLFLYSLDELGATLTEIAADCHDPSYPDCYDAVIDELPL